MVRVDEHVRVDVAKTVVVVSYECPCCANFVEVERPARAAVQPKAVAS